MFKINRILYYLILILIICISSGCNDKSNEASRINESLTKKSTKDNNLSVKANSMNSEADELKKNGPELKTITMIQNGIEPENYKMIANLIEQNSGIDAKLDFQWYNDKRDFHEKLIKAMTTNNLDLMDGGSETIFNKRVNKYEDLTEALSKYAPNIYNELVKNDELDGYKYNDRIYALPNMYKEKRCIVVDIYTDYVKKYAIESIETIEEFMDVLAEIRKNEGISPGFIQNYFSDGTFLQEFIACVFDYAILDSELRLVYKWDDPDMKVIPLEKTPEFKDTVLKFNDMYKTGLVHPSYYNRHNKVVAVLFTVDVAQAVFKNKSFTFVNTTANVDKDKTRFIIYQNKRIQRKSTMRNAKVIKKDSDVVKETLQMLDWLHTNQENYDIFHYGTKNVHYKLVDDKVDIIHNCFIDKMFVNKNFMRQVKNHIDYYGADKLKDSQYPPHQGFVPNIPAYNRGKLFKREILKSITKGDCNNKQLQNAINILDIKGVTETIVKQYQKQLNTWKNQYK